MDRYSTEEIQPSFRLDGKTAVLTGASKGIGLAIARMLGLAGARVLISSRNRESIEAAAAELRSAGIAAEGFPCHMGKPDQVKALVDHAVKLFGRLDIIVNNAATNPVYGPLEATDERAFDKIMDVNVKGPFLLCREALPHLSVHGGSIINISSYAGISPEPNIGIYSVSKSALIALTKAMARQWGAQGIRANAICPGLIRTKFSEALVRDDKLVGQLLEHLPAGRLGSPEDIAGIALYLASDASAYTTGAVHMVDGGMCT